MKVLLINGSPVYYASANATLIAVSDCSTVLILIKQ